MSDLRIPDAARKEPKRSLIAFGLGLYAVIVPFFTAAFAIRAYGLLGVTVLFALFGTMSIRHGLLSTKNARFVPGELVVTDARMTFGGKLLARREDVTQGFVVPTADGWLVRFDRRGLDGPLFVRVKDEAEALSILERFGLDATHVAAQIRVSSSFLGFPLGRQMALMLLPIVLFTGGVMFAEAIGFAQPLGVLAGIVVLMTYLLGAVATPTNVRIGTDGIVASWLFTKRYIAYADVASVTTYKEKRGNKVTRGVRLALRSGDSVSYPTGQTEVDDIEAARFLLRIDEARRAHDAGVTSHPTDVLIRGERPMLEWVRVLRRLGAGVEGPRVPAIPHDVLVGLVEDSAAPAVERASAAVALVASADPELRRRVRIAAETTASPKLRVALEKIATEDDTAVTHEAGIAEALRELEET